MPGHVASTFESWVACDVAFLQRLAVHGWNARTDVCADDTLRWLLTNSLVYSTLTKHEVFRLIAIALPEAGEGRSDLLDGIRAGPGPRTVTPRTMSAVPTRSTTCSPGSANDASFTDEAQHALDELQANHPDFDPGRTQIWTSYSALFRYKAPSVPSS